MFIYLVRRLLLMMPTLLGVLTLTFVMTQFVPGGPVDRIMMQLRQSSPHGEGASGGGADYLGNQGVAPGEVAALKREFGFDKPPLTRYWEMLRRYARLDLGQSYFQHQSVWQVIRSKLPVTLLLGTTTMLLTYLIAIPLGISKALRDGSAFDAVSSVALLAGYAVPGFVLGVVLLMLFSSDTFLQIFPLGGLVSDNFGELGIGAKVIDVIWHLMLPLTASVAGNFAIVAMLTKNSFLDELGRQYVLTARGKGASRRDVVWKHVLRNALLPIISGFPIAFISTFVVGNVLIETLFSLDGVGRLSYDAVVHRDYPVVLGTLYIFTLASMLAKLLADLAYVLCDPRIRYDGSGR